MLRFAILLTSILLSPYIAAADDPPQRSPRLHGHVHSFRSERNFVSEVWTGEGTGPISPIVAVYDMDDDGRSDLITFDKDSRQVRILSSPGTGRFILHSTVPVPNEVPNREILAARFNSDSRGDLLFWSRESGVIWFALQRIDGTYAWESRTLFEPDHIPTGVLSGHFFGSPAMEILAWGVQPRPWSQFIHSFEGGLAPVRSEAPFYDTAGRPRADAMADFDGDGIDEVLSPNFLGAPAPPVRLMIVSLATPTVSPAVADSPEVNWTNWWVGDFDGDGRYDLLLCAADFITKWWVALKGNEEAFPTSLPEQLFRGWSDRIFVGDFDGDGLDDLLRPPESSEPRFEIRLSRISAPVAGVHLKLDTGENVRTDSHGGFEFQHLSAGPRSIEIIGSSLRYAKEKIDFFAYPESMSREMPILGIDKPTLGVGAPQSRFGDEPGPYLCLGYNRSTGSWESGPRMCGRHYGVYSSGDGTSPTVTCCRLPADDILTNETIDIAERECPDGWIMTGTGAVYCDGPKCPKTNRCTKINSARYQLGPELPAIYFGDGASNWHIGRRLARTEIPLAIRLGVERLTRFAWDIDGCIGSPPGSLLTRRISKQCEAQIYRQLQYRGAPGDPPAGTPVKMFPDCGSLKSSFDPSVGCSPTESQEARK